MLTSGIMGIAFIAALVLLMGAITGSSRRRRPVSNSDGATAYMGDGGADCDGGSADGGGDGGDGGGGGCD